VDKGFTEALTDSDGVHHGTNLGEVLSKESDRLKLKYQRRYKLQAIAKKKPHVQKHTKDVKNWTNKRLNINPQ
jgi:hypothetical protein